MTLVKSDIGGNISVRCSFLCINQVFLIYLCLKTCVHISSNACLCFVKDDVEGACELDFPYWGIFCWVFEWSNAPSNGKHLFPHFYSRIKYDPMFCCYFIHLIANFYLFACRGWRINIYPIPRNSTTCTAWYKLKLKLKQRKDHLVVPMVFFGWRGTQHILCLFLYQLLLHIWIVYVPFFFLL